MKQRLLPVILAFSLIILVIMGCAGMFLFKKYMPSKEVITKQELLEVEGNQVAVFLNQEQQDIFGIYENDQTYLPISWVNTNINERFYWDDIEKMLVYTLPESIVYADKRTMGSSGKPLLIVQDDEVYLSLSLILTYTNIQTDLFDSAEWKRIYLDNQQMDRQFAQVTRAAKSRLSGDIHYPIISELNKGDRVELLLQGEDWTKIMSPDGYIGYLENKRLGNIESESYASDFTEPVYTNIALDEKVCMAFHQTLSLEANKNLNRLLANTEGVNVVAPTWFFLTDNDGAFDSLAEQDYVDHAHDMGMQVWAVLDNFNRGENVRSEILFAKTSARQKLIEDLVKEVKQYKIDGINVDVEGIRAEAGPHYVQFLRELSVACRKEKIVLSIDNYSPSPSTLFYNRAEQGRVADYVVIMGYDEHTASGEAGSVASIGFVRDGIEETLKEVPAEKVINAVPFYTRIWIEEGEDLRSEAFGMEQARKWVEDNQVELYWQEELGQYYGELVGDDGKKFLWMEDERSLQLKVDLIEEFELAGVSSWKLGFEPKEIWDIMDINSQD